jgi:hypothetical protein
MTGDNFLMNARSSGWITKVLPHAEHWFDIEEQKYEEYPFSCII